MVKRAPKTDVPDDRGVRAVELRPNLDGAAGVELDLTVAPVVADLEGLLEGQAAADRKLDRAGENIRDECRWVRDEPDLDFVDLRPAEDETVERLDDRVASLDPVADLEGPRPDEAFVPVGKVQPATLVLQVRLL